MARDRPDEQGACAIVMHALGEDAVTVDKYDDGSLNAMVDAVITYADRHTAALEIVKDVDPKYRQAWARILKSGGQIIDAPSLRYTWHIQVDDDVKAREIRETIVAFLEFLEGQPTARELEWPDGRRWTDGEDIAFAFRSYGITRATPVDERGTESKVILSTRWLGGWGGEPNGLASWVGTFLRRESVADVLRKLVNSGHHETHAFVWITYTTDYSVVSVLEEDQLPTERPDLPEGITHVWIGLLQGGGSVIRWSPDIGWSEVYRIPSDGRLDLPTK